MAQVIITPDLDSIISEVDIAAPIGRVFRAISDAEEVRRRFPELHELKNFFEREKNGKFVPSRKPMPEAVITPDLDAIVCEIDIVAPPEWVYRALTDSRELALWFTDASCPLKYWQMDARKNGRYRYETEKGTIVVNGVSEFQCEGEILEMDPPRLLVYTWVANWHDDKKRKTVVRWELTPAGKGTHVKVTHSGLAQETLARQDYTGGWPGVVEKLKNFVETH